MKTIVKKLKSEKTQCSVSISFVESKTEVKRLGKVPGAYEVMKYKYFGITGSKKYIISSLVVDFGNGKNDLVKGFSPVVFMDEVNFKDDIFLEKGTVYCGLYDDCLWIQMFLSEGFERVVWTVKKDGSTHFVAIADIP